MKKAKKRTQSRGIFNQTFLLLSIFAVVMLNQTEITGIVNETNTDLPSQINPKYLSDKFFIGNTNEQKILFLLYYIGIGVSYNVTIDLQANSSTGVSFSIFSDSGQN
ncbi:MAG: hypothetical protein ACW98W_18140, partial [Candidatus Hodarchaeales archaeon]